MTTKYLKAWLERTAWDRVYWSRVRERARELSSDGCSGVPDWMIWTCYEHDVHYRTHKTISGQEITKREADRVIRVRMQQGSAWGRFYWRSWARWSGVSWFPVTSAAARRAWAEGVSILK